MKMSSLSACLIWLEPEGTLLRFPGQFFCSLCANCKDSTDSMTVPTVAASVIYATSSFCLSRLPLFLAIFVLILPPFLLLIPFLVSNKDRISDMTKTERK